MITFTRMKLTVCDKVLKGEVTHIQKPFRKPGVYTEGLPEFHFDSEPFKFSTTISAFHIPGKLTIEFDTTDNIFSNNIRLENSIDFIKLLTMEWLGKYREQWNKLVVHV